MPSKLKSLVDLALSVIICQRKKVNTPEEFCEALQKELPISMLSKLRARMWPPTPSKNPFHNKRKATNHLARSVAAARKARYGYEF